MSHTPAASTPGIWERGSIPPIGFPALVGRQHEFRQLHRLIDEPGIQTAWISGRPGMGKTLLAKMFAERNRGAFTGGVALISVRSQPIGPVTLESLHAARQGSGTFLVIVDDVDLDFEPAFLEELALGERLHPDARVILLSPHDHNHNLVDLHVPLHGLNPADVEAFLAELPGSGFVKRGTAELLASLGGNPRFISFCLDALHNPSSRADLLRQVQFQAPGIVDLDGNPLSSASPEHRRIVTDVTTVSQQLLLSLARDPRSIHAVTPRRFEEIVAELLNRLGYDIDLTRTSKDGGKDIYAAKHDHLGTFLYIIECKKYAPDRPVGVGLVRQLYGVVQAERATAGILATTSCFTKGAREFQQSIASQLSLKDYWAIHQWLQQVLGRG